MDQTSQSNMEVLERFPDHRAEVVRRMVADTDFRSLCQDYEDCAQALARWSQAAEASPDRVTEYTQLLEELEQEIREILESKS
jgi:hypothetical protein